MQKIKSLVVVVLIAFVAACSPEYIEPLAEQKSENPTVRLKSDSNPLVGNKAPLIIVDGEIVANTALLDMDPNDIVSISVLKGKNAALLYGAKSKNGVVLITTKK